MGFRLSQDQAAAREMAIAFAREFPVFRHFTCARVLRAGQGSATIHKNLLGSDELGWKEIDRHAA